MINNIHVIELQSVGNMRDLGVSKQETESI